MENVLKDTQEKWYQKLLVAMTGTPSTVEVRGNDVEVDNRWVVPYSPILSKAFQAHINVEYCNSVKSIKYICKYVNKGSDMAVFAVESRDEILQYQLGRYISSNEAMWRIFSFPIHERYPAVIHLAVHLENGQRVYFTVQNAIQRVDQPPSTTLTSFFDLCETDEFAQTLLYSEVPRYYTWVQSSKKWQRRKQGHPVPGHPGVFSTDTIGRIYTVHPNNDECFYLRLLLVNVHGPKSFQDIRTVNGETCVTYRDACQRLELLENDSHWEHTLGDAVLSSSPHQIRTLFAIILSSCFPSNPEELWNKYKNDMADDILHRMRRSGNPDLQFSAEIYNEALILIEDLCLMMSNKRLNQLGMTPPNRPMHDAFNQELLRETQYDHNAMRETIEKDLPLLNQQQKYAYDKLMKVVNDGSGGIYFLDAPGGTGKTFLITLILATIRSQNGIALALASSGIAATLLEGGRTAHSALKLPLNMQTSENPTCNLSKNCGMAKVLQQCKMIVWDECTMAHKKSMEALDRTMRDFRNNQNIFGGTMILLAGDFRQTLPVIPRATPADELNACLKSSVLWKHVKVLTLNMNMRVELQNDDSGRMFGKQLLDIGNGKIPSDPVTGCISFPLNFCQFAESKSDLIQKVFPNIAVNHQNHAWLSERAILAAKNVDVSDLNMKIQEEIDSELITYKSVDSVTNPDEVVNYPTEFLNSLELPGLPPHSLQLKVGSVIIMLRNINQPRLCNGTRLAVKRLTTNVIEATILKGKYKGEDVLIPRIPLIPTDLAFEFKRLQFPVRLAFAMTINKAQGQSLSVCGINLENPCFSHGQLYVACSRVGKPSALFVYVPTTKTKNVVYKKALE
uniref:ATP-dependent DNA helicase n=1 Tax=Cacopsylla melanoneura TaxID=428564 RepID=A0A8D8T3L0_9HEMI